MARKSDIRQDEQAKIVLGQLTTKTVGPPPPGTGLVGDQAPDTIMSADTLDQVKNQVNIDVDNIDVLDVLNTIGQITSTQSQSGPLVSTVSVKSATMSEKTTSGRQTIHKPDQGQVWRCIALSATWSLDSNPTFIIQVGDITGTDLVTVIECTVNATANTTSGEPMLNEITSTGTREGGFNPDIHYDHNHPLSCFFTYGGSTITTNPTIRALVVRVR